MSHKRFSCYFDLCTCDIRSGRSVASYIFARASRKIYKILTNVIIVLIAFFSGLLFGFLTFFHIWCLTPLRKVRIYLPRLTLQEIMLKILFLNGVLLRKFVFVFCGEIVASLTHIVRLVFSGERIDLATLNTSLNGVFLHKV